MQRWRREEVSALVGSVEEEKPEACTDAEGPVSLGTGIIDLEVPRRTPPETESWNFLASLQPRDPSRSDEKINRSCEINRGRRCACKLRERRRKLPFRINNSGFSTKTNCHGGTTGDVYEPKETSTTSSWIAENHSRLLHDRPLKVYVCTPVRLFRDDN